MSHGFEDARKAMVDRQLFEQGVRDPRVLEAMERVPRHRFVPEDIWYRAYEPNALEIGDGQTISQPYMVGSMSEALEITGEETVLEIGTGSGYQAAILAWMGAHVVTVERIPALAARAAAPIHALGLGANVYQVVGDGSAPHFLHCTFDRIVVTAAAPRIPEALVRRLAVGGRLVCPTGDPAMQRLQILDRTPDGYESSTGTACRFVPLLGEQGFSSTD